MGMEITKSRAVIYLYEDTVVGRFFKEHVVYLRDTASLAALLATYSAPTDLYSDSIGDVVTTYYTQKDKNKWFAPLRNT